MTDKFISSVHIQKLGHRIQEIRERALLNIVSKLEHGFVYDNDLARSREILSRLFEWFLFEPCTYQDVALNLILRILKSESGTILIHHYSSKAITAEIRQIRSYVQPVLYPLVDELLDIVKEPEHVHIDVPPLQSDIPLSYRTQCGDVPQTYSRTIGSTATPIEGLIQRDSSLEQQTGIWFETPQLNSTKPSTEITKSVCKTGEAPFRNFTLKWQPLIASDRHVLESVAESLRSPSEPSRLIHSCEFFIDVMLQDFPAEVFLQRPSIVLLFHGYLKSSASSRLTNSILNCLLKLTRCVITRISYYKDPCMYHSKLYSSTRSYSGLSSPISLVPPNTERTYIQSIKSHPSNCNFEDEGSAELQTKQLSIPEFCFMSMLCLFDYLCVKPESFRRNQPKRKRNEIGINLSLALLNELIDLLTLCIKPSAWVKQSTPAIVDVLHKFEEVLVKFGEALEHFRLEVMSNDSDKAERVVQLRLLCSSTNLLTKLVPLSKADCVLPRTLKNALSSTLLDSALARLYPNVHETIFQFVKEFGGHFETDSVKKYEEVNKICKSITAAIKLLRNSKSLPVAEAMELAKEGMPSVEFHRNLSYVAITVALCANKLPTQKFQSDVFETAEKVVLLLLSHSNMEVREEMYKLCCKRVTAAIGPKLNVSGSGAPGSQILFLLRAPILSEIAFHGITSDIKQIQKYADDILLHILKCKILVSEEIWNWTVQALIPTLPVLACYAAKNSALGRTIVSMLDPDAATSLLIPSLEVIKGNLRLLFVDDALVREEAVSRLCWLMTSQDDSRNLLPRLHSLQDKALGTVCQLQRTIDLNKVRPTQHFYQPSALHQVLDLLNSEGVEPVIRRSALTQVSVMLEDPLLHTTFVDQSGIKTVLDIMKSSLTESDYQNYVDCMIPAVCILKNVSLYNASARQELWGNSDAYYYILRGLFLFCSEDRTRQDCSVLLCLLLFHDYMLGSPAKMDLSLPHLVADKLSVPFACNVHWRTSKHALPSLTATLLSDKWCLSSIQIHWNAEWFGGFREVLGWAEVKYSELDVGQFGEQLRLTNADLLALKSSSLNYSISKCLTDIQNGTSHGCVIDAVNRLEGYVHLYVQAKIMVELEKKSILAFPWEYSFSRFLNAPPANVEDTLLLISVLKFLVVLVPFYTVEDKSCWILTILKNPCHCLPNLLQADAAPEMELKMLHQELLSLITVCVWHEQQFLDLHSPKPNEHSWLHVVKIIADNLKFTDSQHFYNLAYLDCVLACLVHLTTAFGWSHSKAGSIPKEPLPGMILGLCELVGAFHSGKGHSAAVSVMGLSITRHVLLVLNHLLTELQCVNVKGWEMCFIGESALEENILCNLCALWYSRDVILRASILQLLTGLAMSSRAAIELVQEIKDTKTDQGIWETALTILLDHEEASIVRENAAALLGNLASHTTLSLSNNLIMMANLTPANVKKGKNAIGVILNLLEDCKFYKELEQILACVYIGTYCCFDDNNANSIVDHTPSTQNLRSTDESAFIHTKNLAPDLALHSASSKSTTVSSANTGMIVMPSLIKNIAIFVSNLLILAEEEVTDALQEYGVIKMFFRSLSNPLVDINDTKDLALYCDILEMNTAVCALLNKAVGNNQLCLGTVLHTRDCLNVMLSLLNPSLYFVNLPQLVYLRNRLWTEVFSLIGVLLDTGLSKGDNDAAQVTVHAGEAFTVVSSVLNECGHQPFLQTVCEAISSNCSTDLQQSALTSLTSLLRLENKIALDESSIQENALTSSSIKEILDNTKTPRTPTIEDSLTENIENIEPEQDKFVKVLWQRKYPKTSSKQTINVLENAYFGKVSSKLNELNKGRAKSEKTRSNQDKATYLDLPDNEPLMAGAELCRILLYLYDVCNIRGKDHKQNRKKTIVINTLTSILCVSWEAKRLALQNGLMAMIMQQLKELHVRLSLESVECLRRIGDKKRVCPVLKELGSLVGLVTNFMLGEESIKCAASTLGLADVVHKLWVWFCVERSLLSDALKMLCTYTTDCYVASQSLSLTSPVAGAGPRRAPSNLSLLHEIVALIYKEMDFVSRTHDLNILELAFYILHNSCIAVECRSVLTKSNLLQSVSRLHPAITKRQKPWENVELIWLEFLLTLTGYPEGQACIAKTADALELVMMLTSSAKLSNKKAAMLVLRNIAFYQPNRARLLNSDDFLAILPSKLASGTTEEKNVIVTIMWALIANNQRAKLVLKCAGLDVKLQEAIKRLSLSPDEFVNPESMNMMLMVLSIMKDGEKLK